MATTNPDLPGDSASPRSSPGPGNEWSVDLVTNDGTRFRARPACPDDEEALANFFRHLPPDDLRHRFLTGIREVGGERLKEMARNDDPHIVNFLAIEQETGAIIASAMLAASEDYSQGEFAVSTRPEWKQRGVSWTLLEHLVRYATSAGIRILQSIETSDDARALQLEREMGFKTRLCPGDSTLMIAEKQLQP
jgi:acetyltransferase